MRDQQFQPVRPDCVQMRAQRRQRPAAIDQLVTVGGQAGAKVITRPGASDPVAVASEARDEALGSGFDFLIVDTAGRLQTHQNLMEELGKIYRVIGKRIPDGPHEALLVLDATTGQNGISQAKHFSDAVHCSGLILSKLDGSAKGGVAVAIRQTMGIPVKYVGLGEQIDDLEVFDPDRFVDALIDEGPGE